MSFGNGVPLSRTLSPGTAKKKTLAKQDEEEALPGAISLDRNDNLWPAASASSTAPLRSLHQPEMKSSRIGFFSIMTTSERGTTTGMTFSAELFIYRAEDFLKLNNNLYCSQHNPILGTINCPPEDRSNKTLSSVGVRTNAPGKWHGIRIRIPSHLVWFLLRIPSRLNRYSRSNPGASIKQLGFSAAVSTRAETFLTVWYRPKGCV